MIFASGLPKVASLPVATSQLVRTRLLNGSYDFDYIYFTESDQVRKAAANVKLTSDSAHDLSCTLLADIASARGEVHAACAEDVSAICVRPSPADALSRSSKQESKLDDKSDCPHLLSH